MAINKNDYLDVDGNYDLKKSLVDEVIDEINTMIDSGSNPNGRYVKLSDGTQICWGAVGFNTPANIAIGALFNAEVNSTFSSTFISPPKITGNFRGGFYVCGVSFNPVSTTGFSSIIYSPISQTVNGVINYIAIGRWK